MSEPVEITLLRHPPIRCRHVGTERGYDQYDVEVETDFGRIDGTYTYVRLPTRGGFLVVNAFNEPLDMDDDGAGEIILAIHECRKAGGISE